jgi:hypothetical protein
MITQKEDYSMILPRNSRTHFDQGVLSGEVKGSVVFDPEYKQKVTPEGIDLVLDTKDIMTRHLNSELAKIIRLNAWSALCVVILFAAKAATQ